MSSDSDISDLIVRLDGLDHNQLVTLGVLAAQRFARLAAGFRGYPSVAQYPQVLETELGTLAADPMQVARPGASTTLRSAVRAWLDNFDDEPEEIAFWPYQAFVAIEYALEVRDSDDPLRVAKGLLRHCVDLGYLVDENAPEARASFEEREVQYWRSTLDELTQPAVDDEAVVELIEVARRDGDRIVEAALVLEGLG